MPFVVDTFYTQYYLRETAHNKKKSEVYLLGGNYIHKVNFKRRTWETRSKGNYEVASE